MKQNQNHLELVIRDDDLSCFTDPQHLEFLYQDIWDINPIHFSIIPKVYTRQKEIPQNIIPEKDFYFIYENEHLVNFLKQKMEEGKVRIWQHGFTHKNYGNKFELERKDKNILYQELKTGKEILEKTFNIKIDTLVAPHDRFSKGAILAAERLGYQYICRGFGPRPREIQLNKNYFLSYLKFFKFFLMKGKKYRYPKMLNFGRHKEIFSYRIESITKDNIENILNLAAKNCGFVCLTIHHRNFSVEKKGMLKLIIYKINKKINR